MHKGGLSGKAGAIWDRTVARERLDRGRGGAGRARRMRGGKPELDAGGSLLSLLARHFRDTGDSGNGLSHRRLSDLLGAPSPPPIRFFLKTAFLSSLDPIHPAHRASSPPPAETASRCTLHSHLSRLRPRPAVMSSLANWNDLPVEMKLTIVDQLELDDVKSFSRINQESYTLSVPALFRVSLLSLALSPSPA